MQKQNETTAQILSIILTKNTLTTLSYPCPFSEPEDKKLNVDIQHFRKPYVLREPNYWFIILKGTMASLCITLNTIHLLNTVGLFPPTFSFFKLKATSYNVMHAITSATNNINKLPKDRVGLVVRRDHIQKCQKSRLTQTAKVTYPNFLINTLSCDDLINSYQWSQWTEFEKQDGQRCCIIRYYNLRIIKVGQSITEKETLSTHCPATVQYKDTWERAYLTTALTANENSQKEKINTLSFLCNQPFLDCPQSDFQPLENYINLSYDKAFCIVKSSQYQPCFKPLNSARVLIYSMTFPLESKLLKYIASINAPYVALIKKSLLNDNVIINKRSHSLDIQRGTALKSYWIGVERTNGRKWLINGRPINFDSRSNRGNRCYDMVLFIIYKILLSTEAYKKYTNKEKYSVSVKNGWFIFFVK
ncbi:unnamed protein product [Wuchereria bancrofti]|uniref:Uncharacterized protein n=1 Tax=Wuchereria bancrofti TaxID=6293 RepID=A0A3P7E1S5_WUCBA|nr:unnamed protein product [Wuchereria bancrofti]